MIRNPLPILLCALLSLCACPNNNARVELESVLHDAVLNKRGLEIGGPSSNTGPLIYPHVASMDNLVFSSDTVWAHQADNTYRFAENKTGKNIINDAVDPYNVADASYDFLFASHALEHIANPIKALLEWDRIIVRGGYIILVLPEKSVTFDHRRQFTTFNRLLAQYQNHVEENDLSSLAEILELHDLSRDPAAGAFEEFKQRSLDNYNNRTLHHFVYSPGLLRELCDYMKYEFIYTQTEGVNIWFIMRKVL